MKIHGTKKEASFSFCFKKYACPICNQPLKRTKRETVVNSDSEEAKNYDFSNGDGFLVGNIKFIETAFHCETCDKIYSLKEIKKKI